MDTPSELSRINFEEAHRGECITCKYYRKRRTFRNGQEHILEWCENENSDNYKQLLEDIYSCDDWAEQSDVTG